MSLAAEIFSWTIENVGGWLIVLVFLVYELFTPIYLSRETALSPLVKDVPEKVDNLSEDQEVVKEKVNDVEDQVEEVQKGIIMAHQVQRAQARANPQMKHEKVDEHVTKNGVDIDTFLKGDEMTGWANWRSVEDDEGDE